MEFYMAEALLTTPLSASRSSPCLVWSAWWASGTVAAGPRRNLRPNGREREKGSYNYRNKRQADTRLYDTTCVWLGRDEEAFSFQVPLVIISSPEVLIQRRGFDATDGGHIWETLQSFFLQFKLEAVEND